MTKKYLYILAAALCLLLVLPIAGLHAQAPADPVFRSLQWKHTILVLTGEPNDPLVDDQIAIFKDNAESIERYDIAMIRFMRDRLWEMREFNVVNYRGWFKMNAHQQRYVEQQLETDNNIFSVALVGKDGALIYVWKEIEEAVPMSEILYMIDNPPEKDDAAKNVK